jgi:hypothetical protein
VRCVAAISLLAAVMAAGALLAPSQPLAAKGPLQATVTPSPTPKVSGLLRLLLKAAANKSPDATGNGTDASVRSDLPLGDQPPIPFIPGMFEYIQTRGPTMDGVTFEISDANGALVYQHTEQNAPYCPFRDANGKCNGLDVRNDAYWWPPSDDDSGISPQPVQPGKYALSVRTVNNNPERSEFWGTAQPFEFFIEFGPPVAPPVALPPLTGRASITAPRNGSVLRGVVNIRGAATSNNFSIYKFELVDARCDKGVCFLIDFKRPVNNGVLWRWDTRTALPNGVVLQNGDYVMRLVVVDKWGRVLPNPPQFRFTIRN